MYCKPAIDKKLMTLRTVYNSIDASTAEICCSHIPKY